MLTRELKLKPNKTQTAKLEQWLWNLTGVYNWTLRKVELDAQDKIYYSKFDLQNLLANHCGGNNKLVGRLHEKIKNKRKDWNHKISRYIVENFKEIYITKDNLRNQAKIFGKSIMDAGINQLRQFIAYKSDNHNRKCVLVNSKFTTMTCSNCLGRTGPTGLDKLAVRNWECGACGVQHDRDVNAAKVILNFGLGYSLGVLESSGDAR